MKNTVCYIVGGGDFTLRGLAPQPGDLLLAADKGWDYLEKSGLRPQLVIGDMDSISQPPRGIPLARFPRRKSDTDMALAVKLAYARGWRRFYLYGASGGRMDHFFANIQLLAWLAQKGCCGQIVAADFTVHAIRNGTLAIGGLRTGDTVSVFAVCGAARGVSYQGLSYPLHHARLRCDVPLGVSNHALGNKAMISVRQGTLIVFVSSKAH